MEMNKKRGWLGMLGSIDCMHWTWKNCPKVWHGMYCGKSRDPTIVLEAVASQDLWIWHCFFGLPGTLNDINVLQRSHLFKKLIARDAPTCNYKIMGHEYSMGLQARFAIVRGPARFWDKETLVNIMTCCVILHNMIIEDERGLNLPCFYDNVGTRVRPKRNPNRLKGFLQTYREIEDKATHKQLVNDLIQHH
jgi:hypothetical protein